MKKCLVIALFAATSFSATAHWDAGIKYLNIRSDDSPSISLNAVEGSIGYHYELSPNFSLIPELRYAIGIGSDDVRYLGSSSKFKLDGFFAISPRVQYDFDNRFYAFVQPTYSNIRTEVTFDDSTKASGDEWSCGGGVGAGYRFTEVVSGDVSYEWIDNVDVITLGLRFDF